MNYAGSSNPIAEHVNNYDIVSRNAEMVEEFAFKHLKPIVLEQLRKKRLDNKPPRFLGYEGESWLEGEGFSDLLWDCYAHVFCLKIGSLRENLLNQENIDGFVRLHVKNFLTDQQKQAGRSDVNKVVRITRECIEMLHENGDISYEADKSKPRNTTLVIVSDSGRHCTQLDLQYALECQARWEQKFQRKNDRKAAFIKLVGTLQERGYRTVFYGELVEAVKAMYLVYLERHLEGDLDKKQKNSVPRRTTVSHLSYLTKGTEDDVLTLLQRVVGKLNHSVRTKGVMSRMNRLIEYMVECLESDCEFCSASAQKALDYRDRRRFSEDFNRLKMLVSQEIEGNENG